MKQKTDCGVENTAIILDCVRRQHENTVERNNHLDSKISNLYLIILAIVPICANFFDKDSLLNSGILFYKILVALFFACVLVAWIILLKGSLHKKYIYRFGIKDYQDKDLDFYRNMSAEEMNLSLIKHYSEAISKNSELIKYKVKIVKKTQCCLFAAIVLLLVILIGMIF